MKLTCVDVTGQATLHVPFELRFTGSASPEQTPQNHKASASASPKLAWIFISLSALSSHTIYTNKHDWSFSNSLPETNHTLIAHSNGCLKPRGGRSRHRSQADPGASRTIITRPRRGEEQGRRRDLDADPDSHNNDHDCYKETRPLRQGPRGRCGGRRGEDRAAGQHVDVEGARCRDRSVGSSTVRGREEGDRGLATAERPDGRRRRCVPGGLPGRGRDQRRAALGGDDPQDRELHRAGQARQDPHLQELVHGEERCEEGAGHIRAALFLRCKWPPNSGRSNQSVGGGVELCSGRSES